MREPHKVVLYSHDSQGLGHLRRNLAIAHQLVRDVPAITGRDVTGLIISGLSPELGFPLPAGFDWVTIPGVAKGKHGYEPRNLHRPTKELIALRSELLDAALLNFAPDMTIIDRHIFGVWHELRAPLLRLRTMHPESHVVLGLRDILDTPDVAQAEWEERGDPHLLEEIIDHVWIYGDPAVHDSISTREVPPILADRAHYTGYLASGRDISDREAQEIPEPYVLTTVGGGSDGYRLLRTAVGLQPPPGHRHVVVAGPQFDDADFARMRALAPAGTDVHKTLPGISTHIARAAAVISMGGYNTVCETLATTTPALIVPRETPRLEQFIRATALNRIGVADMMRSGEITTQALTRWAQHAVTRRVDRSFIKRDGLTHVARYAAELLLSDSLVGGRR